MDPQTRAAVLGTAANVASLAQSLLSRSPPVAEPVADQAVNALVQCAQNLLTLAVAPVTPPATPAVQLVKKP